MALLPFSILLLILPAYYATENEPLTPHTAGHRRTIVPLSSLCPNISFVADVPNNNGGQPSKELQAIIEEYQNPPDCHTARLLLFPPAFGIMGMAATLLHLREAMMLAHATGRTFVAPSDWLAEYINPVLCPQKSLACYFLPFSRCTVQDAGPPSTWGKHICDSQRVVECSPTLDSEGALNITFPAFPGYARHWLLKEYAHFLLRPATTLQTSVDRYSAHMGIEGMPYISVYLRSNKYRADFPAECAPKKDQSGRRILELAQQADAQHVFLAADSVDLRNHVAAFLKMHNTSVVHIPDTHFPTLVLCRGLETYHIQVGLNCYQDRANQTHFDEGLTLLSMFFLLARSKSFMTTECTTIRVLVNELRWTEDTEPQYHSLYPSKSELGRVKHNLRRLCTKCLRFYDHLTPLRRDEAWDSQRYKRVEPLPSSP